MDYEAVAVYSLAGPFIGYAIRKKDMLKLHGTNLYDDEDAEELESDLKDLNDKSNLAKYWPNARDEDVQKLLNDSTFHPLQMIDEEVLDEDATEYVFERHPGVINPPLNWDRTKRVYKTVSMPANPSEVIERMKAACEQIAKQRAAESDKIPA